MKKIFKFLIVVLLLVVIGLGGLVAFLAITKYKPEAETTLFRSRKNNTHINDSTEFSALIWNIGYAGLDKDMDFFFDGGKQVRPLKENSIRNFDAIIRFIASQDDSDFILLQEVDQKAKRSYGRNQVEELATLFPDRNTQFGMNYNVRFVPVPPRSPMGKVKSGLVTVSKVEPFSVTRFSFPGKFNFPMNLAMLDRCFVANRYLLKNGKELVIVNTHNSAYDDGSLRRNEMTFFKTFLDTEYHKGNYILVGGDWNQCPPNFIPLYTDNKFDNTSRIDIEPDYLPSDWTWAYDASIPTNRRVSTPYAMDESLTTVIDFFLLSPNVELIGVKGIPNEFLYSDHNPVRVKFKIRS